MKPDRDRYGAIDIVAACNNREILELNLLQSPEIASGLIKPHLEWHATSAGAAYNRALDATRGEIVVFAHQDVYLPAGWTRLLMRRVRGAEPDQAGLGPAQHLRRRPEWMASGHRLGFLAWCNRRTPACLPCEGPELRRDVNRNAAQRRCALR